MTIRQGQTNWFNKGPLENNPSNPGNPRNHSKNPKKPMQPQNNKNNSKATPIEIEVNTNKMSNTDYDVQYFTDNEASSDNKPVLATWYSPDNSDSDNIDRNYEDNDHGDKTKLESLKVPNTTSDDDEDKKDDKEKTKREIKKYYHWLRISRRNLRATVIAIVIATVIARI